MKFKNLTEEIKERMYQIYWNKEMKWDDRMKSLMDITGKSERTVRKWCVKLGFKNKIEEESEDLKIAKERELNDNKQYYIITYAQNATNVNKAFLKNIEAYANKLDAEIICIAGRYHNPTTLKKSEKAQPHLKNQRRQRILIIGTHLYRNTFH
jgi:ribosome-binding ATPase YchF (GTP1/OBG family)